MSQSHSFLLVHIIFSTKNREPSLSRDIRAELRPYLATVARNAGCECYGAGGVTDHVHIAVRLPRDVTVAGLVKDWRSTALTSTSGICGISSGLQPSEIVIAWVPGVPPQAGLEQAFGLCIVRRELTGGRSEEREFAICRIWGDVAHSGHPAL